MRIAVTGASGFIGRNLIRELTTTGHQIIAFYNRQFPQFSASNLTWIKVDIHSLESLKGGLAGVEIIYHLVGIIAETKELTFEQTVTVGTRNLITAAKFCHAKKIIYLSALGTSPTAESKYFQTKWAAEESVRNSGLEYLILRPSIIFGQDDKFLNKFTGIIRYSPIIPLVGNGRQPLQPIYIKDLINILRESLSSHRAINKVIEIGGPEKYEFREIIAILKKILNKKRINIYIPIWFLQLAAIIMEKIIKPSPVTVDQLKMLSAGSTCDNSELIRIYGIRLTKLENGLREYLR